MPVVHRHVVKSVEKNTDKDDAPVVPPPTRARRGSIFVTALAAEHHLPPSDSSDHLGSMIVRSGRTTHAPHSTSPVTGTTTAGSSVDSGGSGTLIGQGDGGFIVTPFAQVLVSLQRIRIAFMRLTAAESTQKITVSMASLPEPDASDVIKSDNPDYSVLASETLSELEWCLKQLETIQTKRPVSDMAFSKFKRLLSKELSNFSESDKSRNEISAYICGTFLDDLNDAEPDQEIAQMMERRRSSAQSHMLGGVQEEPESDVKQTSKAHEQPAATKDLPFPVGDQSLPKLGLQTVNETVLDEERDLLQTFSIDPATFVRYLLRIESIYHSDVPYHNSMHAADVMQTSHYLLQADPLKDVFGELEILAVLFASAIHDVDHPGLTNQYLINTSHELALQYNDNSVLENHHVCVAFKVLNEKGCDFLSSMNAKKRHSLRRMVIDLVLATDMSKHMNLLADLRTMVETKKVSGPGVLNMDNYADRLQILQNMIHCSDLSNPAKPLKLYQTWTSRLIEEFFRQGDKERKLGIEISPMCDRESVAVAKSQVTFIEFVVHPLWETWCDLVHPAAQLILDTLEENREYFEARVEAEQKGSGQSIVKKPTLATAEELAEDDEDEGGEASTTESPSTSGKVKR